MAETRDGIRTDREGPESDLRLRMRGVSKRFGATVALDRVDLDVAAGEVHALVGENGAGKSTLMKVLSGAIAPDAGTMALDGQTYRPRGPLVARREGVAMIYQELSLAPHLSVMENVLLGMESTRRGWLGTLGVLNRKQMRSRAVAALAELGHPEIRPDVPVCQLSIAAAQLVEIARAVAVGCRVLVLDEPTSSLGQSDIEKLFELIGRLKQQGHAIVYISHFLEEVRRISDRFTVLRDGRTVGSGTTDEVDNDRLIRMMVGREVENLYPHSARVTGETLLEIENLAGVTLPESASLALRRGEVVGIAGLVGAGRSELLRAIFGLEPIRSGEVRLGVYSGAASPETRWRQGMGLLSENRKEEGLALGLPIDENLTLSKLDSLGPGPLVLPGRRRRAAADWIDRLGIKCHDPRQAVSSLSGGNQQKVAFARLLYHDVDCLLLDEPTRGIDVGSKALLYEQIDRLAVGDPQTGREPKAILLVSSYLPELLGVCDRVAVMHRGRLGPLHAVDEVNEHQLMCEATGIKESV